ncbi:MAG: hypothetical protein JWM47_2484 [Acidimicrobiales bacterium]|nr:hypothetical protein [Acidimicrobiales bacterium]
MAASDRYQTYDLHGSSVTSLPIGLADIAMSPTRQRAAVGIVSDLLALNEAEGFVWYLPPATPELSCYWDAAPTNLLWITTIGVHIKRDGPVLPLPRPLTYQKQDGDYVGWLLPGAEAGAGGGPKRPEVATVLCPASSLRQPAGQV